MKTTDLLLLGGLAVAAYYFLSPKTQQNGSMGSNGGGGGWGAGGSASASEWSYEAGNSTTDRINDYLANAGIGDGKLNTPIISPSGHYVGTDVFKGRLSINQDAQIANIRAREGENVGLTFTDNPLEVKYSVAGSSMLGNEERTTFTSTRRPSNQREADAARLSNLKRMAAADPSYTKTASYQKAMSELGGS